MSETRLPPTLSPAEARQIVQTCDRFEAAWKVGPPRPEDFLNTIADTIRPALLQQLLILDWDYRQRTGDGPCVADYQARFPNDHALIEDISREMSNAADSTFVGANESAISTSAELGAREAALTGAINGGSRYQLLNEVGHGGIGVVYRGRDTHLGRELAVKVLRETYRDDANARQRLIEEARIGSQLQHPAIVPVYEQGRLADGRPYFAMKLVEGHTLAELLHNRVDPRRDLPRFLGAFHQVCQAMAYTHSRGIVHRDLKPANIMVGAFGEVQVMDWGFAKVLDQRDDAPIHRRSPDRDDRSHTGTLMGTPAYMPPEQARGRSR